MFLNVAAPLRFTLPTSNMVAVGFQLENLSDRVWYAWHCLPRNARGKPPAWRKLELDHGLPQAVLSKLSSGERKSVDSTTLGKLAGALSVSANWLLDGTGDPPALTGPMRPRREAYAAHDPAEWVKLAPQLLGEPAETTALGDVPALTEFDIAVRQLGERIQPEAVKRARSRYRKAMDLDEAKALLRAASQEVWKELAREEAARKKPKREPKVERPARRKVGT